MSSNFRSARVVMHPHLTDSPHGVLDWLSLAGLDSGCMAANGDDMIERGLWEPEIERDQMNPASRAESLPRVIVRCRRRRIACGEWIVPGCAMG